MKLALRVARLQSTLAGASRPRLGGPHVCGPGLLRAGHPAASVPARCHLLTAPRIRVCADFCAKGQWPGLRTLPPPLYVNQTHEDWSLPAYSVFRAGRDPARHLFFRRGGNRKSQCRATGRPVGQRQSGAAFADCVSIFTCNLRCKVPCSILHATLSF